MRPRDTVYRLAIHPQDYKRAQALLRSQDVTGQRLSHPTIMAERSDQLVGVLGTYTQHGHIVAGPLVLAPDLRHPVITWMRVVETYEGVLRLAGVSRYLFSLSNQDEKYRAALAKLGMEPYKDDGNDVWYQRLL